MIWQAAPMKAHDIRGTRVISTTEVCKLMIASVCINFGMSASFLMALYWEVQLPVLQS